MLPQNYTCDGQISIFDILEPDRDNYANELIDDADVMEIYNRVSNLCIANRMSVTNQPEYNTWEHVPNLGKRLFMGFSYSANTRPFKDFYDKLDEIIEFANGRHVELKPSCVPCFPNNDSEPEVTLYFSTLFMDNRRRMK